MQKIKEFFIKVGGLLLKIWNNPTLRRYFHSSLVTFLAFFLPLVYLELKKLNVDNLEAVSVVGLFGVVSRIFVKAIYEMLLVQLAKYKK